MFKNSTIIFHCLESPLDHENDVKLLKVDNRKLSLSICYFNDIEWNIFNTGREIRFVKAAMFCVIFITHQWNAKLLFALKSLVYYVAIATVIFSHVKKKMSFSVVKISCFVAKAHLVFH